MKFFIVLILSFVLIAGFAVVTAQPGMTFVEYKLTRPPAYADAPYWSAAFVKETAQSSWEPTDDGLWIPSDQHGEYINATGGFRHTTGQPVHYRRTLWLFGSSSIWDGEVPDAYTIASRLQARLPDTRVMNVGMSGATFQLQYYRLRTLPITPDDIVIFYGGAIEARDAGDGESLDALFTKNEQAIHDGQTYAESRGATFVALLQPILFTLPVAEADGVYPAALHYESVMRAAYARFREWADITDISRCLDNARRAGLHPYLDQMHITHKGDAIVAGAIYQWLTNAAPHPCG